MGERRAKLLFRPMRDRHSIKVEVARGVAGPFRLRVSTVVGLANRPLPSPLDRESVRRLRGGDIGNSVARKISHDHIARGIAERNH